MQGQSPSLTMFLFPAHSGKVGMSSRIGGPGLARSKDTQSGRQKQYTFLHSMLGIAQKGSEFRETDRMVGIVPFSSTEMLSSLGDKTA